MSPLNVRLPRQPSLPLRKISRKASRWPSRSAAGLPSLAHTGGQVVVVVATADARLHRHCSLDEKVRTTRSIGRRPSLTGLGSGTAEDPCCPRARLPRQRTCRSAALRVWRRHAQFTARRAAFWQPLNFDLLKRAPPCHWPMASSPGQAIFVWSDVLPSRHSWTRTDARPPLAPAPSQWETTPLEAACRPRRCPWLSTWWFSLKTFVAFAPRLEGPATLPSLAVSASGCSTTGPRRFHATWLCVPTPPSSATAQCACSSSTRWLWRSAASAPDFPRSLLRFGRCFIVRHFFSLAAGLCS